MEKDYRRDFLVEQKSVQGILYTISDFAAVILAGWVAFKLAENGGVEPQPFRIAVIISLFLVRITFSSFDLYRSWRGRSILDQLRKVVLAWITVLIGLITIGYLLGESDKLVRDWLFIWAVMGLVFIFISRSIATVFLRSLRKSGWNRKRIIIVGAGDWGKRVARRVLDNEWIGFDIQYFLDHRQELQGEEFFGIPVIGGYGHLTDIAHEQVDEVWICLPISSTRLDQNSPLEEVRHALRHCTITQRLMPDFEESWLINRPVVNILGLPVVNLNTSPMRGWNQLIKEMEDFLLAAFILVLVSPLMLLISLVIKLTSSGPVLFKQMRHGWDGRSIRIYKFRTMMAHQEPEERVPQATRTDERITAFGRFLRKTSLDELPQFLNVLQGRMSIVGPRPHAISHNEHYKDQIDSYMQRHKVKPGITGWAQVNGLRGETETLDKMKKRVEFDLFYIENWSFWFDLKIICLTIFKGFINKNAY